MNDIHAAAMRYRARREAAFIATWEALMSQSDNPEAFAQRGIRLEEIEGGAIATWRTDWVNQHPDGGFDWAVITEHFRRNVDQFECALWEGDQLCGLGIGRPSDGNDNLTIHFLEGFNGDHPLKGLVAPIILDAADNYAKVIGKQWVKLKDPRPGAIPIYDSLGFSVAEAVGAHTYYARKVDDGTGL